MSYQLEWLKSTHSLQFLYCLWSGLLKTNICTSIKLVNGKFLFHSLYGTLSFLLLVQFSIKSKQSFVRLNSFFNKGRKIVLNIYKGRILFCLVFFSRGSDTVKKQISSVERNPFWWSLPVCCQGVLLSLCTVLLCLHSVASQAQT